MHTCSITSLIYASIHRVIFSQFSQPGAETTKANRTGIQLLGVVAANGMAPYDPETAGSDLNEEK